MLVARWLLVSVARVWAEFGPSRASRIGAKSHERGWSGARLDGLSDTHTFIHTHKEMQGVLIYARTRSL